MPHLPTASQINRSIASCDRTSKPSVQDAMQSLANLAIAFERATTAEAVAHATNLFLGQHGFSDWARMSLPTSGLGHFTMTPMGQHNKSFWRQTASDDGALFSHLGPMLEPHPRPLEWREGMPFPHQSRRRSATWARAARQADVTYCLFVPLFRRRYHIEVASLTASSVPDPTTRPLLVLGLRAADTQWRQLARVTGRPNKELTEREAEISRWLAAGKSDWETAQILDISAKTVNFHVENIKRKFGVGTRLQAIVALLCDPASPFRETPP